MTSIREDDFTDYVLARAPRLRGMALRLMAGHEQSADDLVQVTLTKTYVKWGRIKDVEHRDAYIRRIMTRTAQRMRGAESARREVLGASLDDRADPPGKDGPVEDRALLWQLLGGLSPKQRTAIVLRYYEDLSERDTADAMGTSPGSVKTHTSRALARMRLELDSMNSARSI